MAYLSVSKKGVEAIHRGKPEYIEQIDGWDGYGYQSMIGSLSDCVYLPKGSIRKLIGRDINFYESPVELN